MKRQLLSFLLLLLFAFSISAQTKEPRKIDEFSSVTCNDLRSRLDVLATEVKKVPSSKGYIIVYEGKYVKFKLNDEGNLRPTSETSLPAFAKSAYMTKYMMNHLLGFRSLSREKYLFISGGFRELFTVELWLVPSKAILKPTPTLKTMKYQKKAASGYCGDF